MTAGPTLALGEQTHILMICHECVVVAAKAHDYVLVNPELVAAVRKMIAYQGKNCDYQNENQSCWACGESACRYHEINFLLPKEDGNGRG
jgi:ABC-type Mn2+/Zn2+ transport system ATPase subunit